jgi:peroxiredoxin
VPPPPAANRPYVVLGQFAFVIAAAAVVYGFVAVTREAELRRRCNAACLMRPNYMGADRRAPSFELKDLSGKPTTLKQFEGKVIVLNFWTRTCGPCLEEMPEFAELAKVLREKSDVAVITISIDETPQEAMGTLKSLLKEDPPFLTLLDPDNKVVKGKFGTTLFPETWIIDKNGVIRARFDGAKEWSNPAVVEYVEQLRNGGYCPIDIAPKGGHVEVSGAAAKLCEGSGT